MSEIDALLEKAGKSFAAARLLLGDGYRDFAVSRAYYGYFYVAEALLRSMGLEFSSHGQVLAQYGRHFAKEEILDRRYHRSFNEAFSSRQLADYSTRPPLEPEKVTELIEVGEEFLREARAYLAR